MASAQIWTEPDASSFLIASFTILGIALALLFVLGAAYASRAAGESPDRMRRRVGALASTAIAWLAATWLIADAGLLARDGTPPPFVPLVVTVFTLAVAIAFSPLGRLLATHVPLAALVIFQGYRLPLELLMHRAWTEGVMPIQMSYSGQNWDIVTGVTALAAGAAVARGVAGRKTVWAWNILGTALVANIIFIAIRSTPAIAAYGPDHLNTWVMHPPFVWLPAVMVLLAIAGHLVVFRALART